jgi:uncharacterized zinc-type alcohol dehydrogenase-like protein
MPSGSGRIILPSPPIPRPFRRWPISSIHPRYRFRPHDYDAYLGTLALDGVMVTVGVPDQPISAAPFSLIMPRRSLAGSAIGGIPETQEMLDYCAEHNITSDVEVIPIQKINEAYERLLRNDVKYRFVIDMASLKGGAKA